MKKAIYNLAWIWLSTMPLLGQATEVDVHSFPATPLIEIRDGRQLLNFDLAITNNGENTLRLSEVEMTVFNPVVYHA